MAKKPTKQKSGSARMLAAQLKPVLLWLTADEHHRAKSAAQKAGLRVTQVFKNSGLATISEILAK